MKIILLNILAILVVIGVAVPLIGSTMATFSDSETSYDNYIETADLDLKVNGEDDEPWGWGIAPCIQIDDGEISTSYYCSVSLWNAGCVGGMAYLHIKNLVGPDWLSQNLDVEIWYDGSQVTSGSINDLTCQQVLLGELVENETKDVNIVLHATAGAPGESLAFDIAFELFGNSFSDIETSQGNYFGLNCELGGTHGFWNGPGALNEYGETETEAKAQIVSWFREIVWASLWFEDELAGGTDDEVYDKMVGILTETGAAEYEGAVNQFRLQYLATRLNTKPTPPRLALDTPHNISSIPGATGYFGYSIGTLQEILATIEINGTDGLIFDPPPSGDDMLIMKDVCDALNNVTI